MNFRRGFLFLCLLLAGGAPLAVAPARDMPWRVLMLHSFGYDVPPFSEYVSPFRKEFALRMGGQIDFYDVSLLDARFEDARGEQSFIDYLTSLFSGGAPDVVIAVGGPAVRFAQKQRATLFPAVPLLLSASDRRVVRDAALLPQDSVAAVKFDFSSTVADILRVLPRTNRLAIVLGDSPIERYWVEEFRRELQPFSGRVTLEWFNRLSFEEMKRRAAAMPKDSAILYALLVVDGAGVPRNFQQALKELYAVSAAPIFGLFESQMGMGVVGGRLISHQRLGEETAQIAAQVLKFPGHAGIHMTPVEPERPAYDWNELRRWNIREADLPPGSVLRFQEEAIWARHPWETTGIVAVIVFQGITIGALLLNRARRRRAEREALALGGRLLTAYEDEHRRLARELHDDVTQRLARLTIDAASLEKGARAPGEGAALRDFREHLARLSDDVHALSYRLHPSVIEDLGLVEALRAECESVTHRESLRVDVAADGVPHKLPHDTALCLFRVAQESLRNVARHAAANAVHVLLECRDGGMCLTIRDDGVGFDSGRSNGRASLGHASMRERMRLLGGRLDIDSTPGRGTTVTAWVPLAGDLA